jgi:hypothetical protein
VKLLGKRKRDNGIIDTDWLLEFKRKKQESFQRYVATMPPFMKYQRKVFRVKYPS